MIDIKNFVINPAHKKEFQELINVANLSLKNWDINWTNFLQEYIFEEIFLQLQNLSDISFFRHGGYENSSRIKVACYRTSIAPTSEVLVNSFPGEGIDIRGNFLFDNANQTDFRNFIMQFNLSENEIGDIWTLRDQGAQGIIAKNTLNLMEQEIFHLRDVETKLKKIKLEELQTPIPRTKKFINTVEASLRLDAIASAGFRISRNKISNCIQIGLLRLNGEIVNKATIAVKIGDILMLENKGVVEIFGMERTKRNRWKIKLIKK